MNITTIITIMIMINIIVITNISNITNITNISNIWSHGCRSGVTILVNKIGSREIGLRFCTTFPDVHNKVRTTNSFKKNFF